MAPRGPGDLLHRLRRAHPLGPLMRHQSAAVARATPDGIRRYQERRLRALVRLVAARSPFYRRWFAGSGVDPATIRTLADLPRLPLLDRSDLMAAPEDFAVYPTKVMWRAQSSGTSGRTVQVYRTPGASTYELVTLQRQWAWFGLPTDARRLVLRGSGFAADRPGRLTAPVRGDHRLLLSSFHLTAAALPEIMAEIRAYRPHAVEGWPSSIALLAALLRDAGEQLPVLGVVTSSEVLSPDKQQLMREVFDAPVIDHYGQTERVVMAGTCEVGGYHVFPDYGIAELLPVDGAAERFEIVGTPLHNWGFPVLRYRTGDQVGPAPDGPCGCGRAFPRLGAIDGRSEDAFVAADGRVIPHPAVILSTLTGLREAQVAQLDRGRFEFRLVPGERFDEAATTRRLRAEVDRIIGTGQDVSFRIVDRVPRQKSGKVKAAVVLGGPVGSVP